MSATPDQLDMEFAFPALPAPRKLPLTAKSTVTHLDSSGKPAATGVAPSGVAVTAQQQEAMLPSPPPPPPSQQQQQQQQQPAQGFQRNKVPFEKGYSQMDWVRLTRTHPDLAGRSGAPVRKDISMQEVRQHNKVDDAWMVLNGRVYNITPYLRYHPGGVDILAKSSGRDGTMLFKKYHAWVNGHALLEKCLVGWLQPDEAPAGAARSPLGNAAPSVAASTGAAGAGAAASKGAL